MIPEKVCQKCGNEQITFYAQINQSGAKVVTARCDKCKQIPFIGMPFLSKKDFEWDTLPLIENFSLSSEPCAVCGKLGTQLHHFAPRHLWPETADEWPTAYLCQDHHDEWHRKTKTGAWRPR